MASELVKSGASEKAPAGLQAAAKDVKFLHARDLSIVWGDDPRYWQWLWIKENDKLVEAAKLVHVWWFDVRGSYDMSELKIGSTYHVVFEVIMQHPRGWEYGPVTLTLVLPTGEVVSTKKFLNTIPPDYSADLEVGHFVVPPNAGKILISLAEIERLYEKAGIVIMRVRIEEV